MRFVFGRIAAMFLVAIALLSVAARAAEGPMVRVVSAMDSTDGVDVEQGEARVVAEGPGGSTVLRFDDRFRVRLEPGKRGVDPRDFDLIKIAVKADAFAVLKVDLQNHPGPGDRSYWWALDGIRGAFGWRTLWLDLRVIEDIKARGDARDPWREGAEGGKGAHALTLEGFIKDTGREAGGGAPAIRLGPVRFVKKAVDVDWDQARVSCARAPGGDVVFTYPLEVTNCFDEPVTARLRLVPFEAEHATATLADESVPLDAGQTKTVAARIALPAAVAAEKPPLYCERFEVVARAEGVEDSEVTVLRSADPIHLTVTVPIDEEPLALPLYPRPSTLPAEVVCWDEATARRLAVARPPRDLIATAMEKGIYRYGQDGADEGVAPFRRALIAAAYLYDFTGERKYLDIASTLLAALPDIWAKHYVRWQARPFREVGSGIITRWGDGHHYTLSLGWRLGGTQRSPYQYSYDHNSRGGSMSSILYAFDMLAPHLDADIQKRFIHDFLVPAGIQCRNHYVGDGNQQLTADTVALYAGLAGRNWPLASFAYSSEHGLLSVMERAFTPEGKHIRKWYQTYVMRPMFWMMETLYGTGINVYRDRRARLRQLTGHGFSDTHFWKFVQERRMQAERRGSRVGLEWTLSWNIPIQEEQP